MLVLWWRTHRHLPALSVLTRTCVAHQCSVATRRRRVVVMDQHQVIEDGDVYLSPEDIDEEIEVTDAKIDDDDGDDEEKGDDEMQRTDDSCLLFTKHQDAVICCAIDSNGTSVVSGDQNDKAYVWDVSTGNVKFECSGHSDTVVCVGFSRNDQLIATGDMNGVVQVWDGSGNRVTGFDVGEMDSSAKCEVTWMRFHPVVEDILLVGASDGTAWMWQISDDSKCKTFCSFGSSNNFGIYLNDGKRSVMGYEDGSVRIWDLKTAEVIFSVSGNAAHKSLVTSIDCSFDDKLIVTGSVDSTAKLINCQSGKVLNTFKCGVTTNEDEDSVESVSLSRVLSLFVTGTVNGIIEVWDISNNSRRYVIEQPSGISKLMWDPSNCHKVLVAGLDGIFRIYDGRSGQLQLTKCGHSDHILDFAVTKDSKILITASEDKTCRVFLL